MRQIYIVNCIQVVKSDSHPEGLYSVMSGYPKTFDSRNYGASDSNPDGDTEKAYNKAEADALKKVGDILDADNSTRAMATVTITRADGVSVYHRCIGKFPYVAPAVPEVEPEEPTDEGEEPIE